MIVYLAGQNYGAKIFPEFNYDFDRLESFFYVRDDNTFRQMLPKYRQNVIIDSGAFTFIMNGDQGIDIDSFTDQYIEFLQEYDYDLFFEMDVDKVHGFAKVKRLRKRIEQKTGKPSIPVFHMDRGLRDFRAMCRDYNYIALGVGGKDFSFTDHKAFNTFVAHAHRENAKVHGLGITGMTVLSKVPFDSVDSSSWTAGNRYKQVQQFDGRFVKNVKVNLDGKRLVDGEGLARHNLRQWISFSKSMRSKVIA